MGEVAVSASNSQEERPIWVHPGSADSEGRWCCSWLMKQVGTYSLTLIDHWLDNKPLFISQQPWPYSLFHSLSRVLFSMLSAGFSLRTALSQQGCLRCWVSLGSWTKFPKLLPLCLTPVACSKEEHWFSPAPRERLHRRLQALPLFRPAVTA